MRKITIIISFFILFDFGLRAQESFEITIGGEGAEYARNIEVQDDGGYLILGATESFGVGGRDVVFFKINAQGEIQWANTYGTNLRDESRKFMKTPDGGYLLACWKSTAGTRDDWFIIKTDNKGNLIWKKFIGDYLDDEVQDFISVSNEYYLIGNTWNYGPGSSNIYLAKMDGFGNFYWFKSYGLNEKDLARGISFTSDTNLMLGCYSKSYGDGTFDYLNIKTDLNGDVIWSKVYNSSYENVNYCFIKSEDNYYYTIGYSADIHNNNKDIFLLKVNKEGDVVWAKSYGGAKDDVGYRLAEMPDGNLLILGSSKSFDNGEGDVIAIKITSSGDIIWAKAYGGDMKEDYTLLDIREDGSFVIAATTYSFGKDNGDFYIINTDTLGNSCCSRNIYNLNEQNIPILTKDVELIQNEGSTIANYSIVTGQPDFSARVVCIQTIKIMVDTVVCGEASGVHYYIEPKLDGTYTWHVPDGAIIVSGQGTSEIVVDFNDVSGYVTASFESYCADKISDSLFVDLSGGFNINLGPDTTFCNGDSLMLSPGSNYFHYLWQDGSTDSLLVADASGTYWVQVTDSSGCKATDSITIDTFPGFDFSIGNDTAICFGDYVFLYAPPGFESYQWQDGSNNTSYIADTSGCYWVQVTDTNNCAARDSMLLTTNKVPADILGNDTLFCKGGTFTLRTNPVYEQYFWNNGSNDSVLTTSQPGKFWVTVFDTLGCSGSDTIQLDYFPAITLELNATGQLCEDDSVILQAVSNYNNYLWQDSSQNQTYIAKDSGIYWVKVTTRCETKSGSITIDACSSLWIPNVFTPNNDGYNDYFGAVAKNIIKFRLVIFNRWGQELKTLHNINEKWDGTYRGQRAAQGTYFWVADYEQVDRDGSIKHIRLQGSVTLIR